MLMLQRLPCGAVRSLGSYPGIYAEQRCINIPIFTCYIPPPILLPCSLFQGVSLSKMVQLFFVPNTVWPPKR